MGQDHRKPLDGVLFLASQIILNIVTVPAFVPRPAKIIAFAAIGWYLYRVIFTQTTGDFKSDFGLGTASVFQYLVALDYALLTPPEELRNFHDNDPTRVNKRPLKARVLWTIRLISNPRGIGWAHEPSHLPPQPSASTPRSRFVFSRVLLATCCFLGGTHLFDAAYAAMPVMADKLLTSAPLHQRILGVLSVGLGGICMISGVHAILSAAAVGCCLSSPDRWPPLFGSPLQVWSIGRFWRRFWHQLIRRSVLTCTTSILGCVFPANYVGTTGYKLARLYVVFCISGIAHGSGDVVATGKLGFKSFTFFMLQPLGITIEVIVSYLWHQLRSKKTNPEKTTANGGTKNIEPAREPHHNGHISNINGKSLAEDSIPPLWIRCVGFIWVASWMVWTAAYMADAVFSARLSANPGQIRIHWWFT